MKDINIVIFNNYIEKKKLFIKSNIKCDNKVNLINRSFFLKNIDYSLKTDNKNNYKNYKINYSLFIN